MHKLDTADSDSHTKINKTKLINKPIKWNNTKKDLAINAVNVEDQDGNITFIYYNVPFNIKRESVFQIPQHSTLYNSNDEENSGEQKEDHKLRDIERKQKKVKINNR